MKLISSCSDSGQSIDSHWSNQLQYTTNQQSIDPSYRGHWRLFACFLFLLHLSFVLWTRIKNSSNLMEAEKVSAHFSESSDYSRAMATRKDLCSCIKKIFRQDDVRSIDREGIFRCLATIVDDIFLLPQQSLMSFPWRQSCRSCNDPQIDQCQVINDGELNLLLLTHDWV